METVPLATLNTNTYQPSIDDLWLMETVFGVPTCTPISTWASSPALWAIALVIIFIVLVIPLVVIGSMYGRRWGLLYVIFILILLFSLIWWFGGAVVNQWRQPHCQQ